MATTMHKKPNIKYHIITHGLYILQDTLEATNSTIINPSHPNTWIKKSK
jgi:hypothetical protein